MALGLGISCGALAESRIDVTPAQERLVRERIDETAVYEASLNVCGDETNVDRQVVEAIHSCVDPKLLARLSEYWREKVSELGTLGLVEENRDDFCRDPETKTMLSGYEDYVDDLIVQAKQFCSQ